MRPLKTNRFQIFAVLIFSVLSAFAADSQPAKPEIRTPKSPDKPRVNGPQIFGVRPGSPFLYSIPATGKRPMRFSVDHLPAGLKIDSDTGQITGKLDKRGEYRVLLRAKNALGEAKKAFRIVVGDEIALTPVMGWNPWNCWESKIDQEKVLAAARALVSSGLSQHGWVYVNIDDGWQGKRGGAHLAIQPNEKFPDMKGLADQIHKMGLKIGIYSTPWTTSYAGFIGGSAETEDGAWEPLKGKNPHLHGKYSFAKQDAQQWGAWGIDYLKYDWNPNMPAEVIAMADALKASGRDIVFSLSNSGRFEHGDTYAKHANSWRTTGDIRDNWKRMIQLGSAQVRWAPFASPGHRPDPDMLEVGHVLASRNGGHPTQLTPDEQYTHITLWSLLGAPMLLGNDLDKLDDFTLGLLTNDEVLDVNQDLLGKQAVPVGGKDDGKSAVVYVKTLADNTRAVGFINETESPATITVKWTDLGLSGKQPVRDLWRQKDLGKFSDQFSMEIPPHGAEMFRIGASK